MPGIDLMNFGFATAIGFLWTKDILKENILSIKGSFSLIATTINTLGFIDT